MNSKGYYAFSFGNEFYLYDFEGSQILLMSEKLYSAVKKYTLGVDCSFEENKYISELQGSGLLSNVNWANGPDLNDDIAYLTFAPTYTCNFRCTYCFGDHGEKYSGVPRSFEINTLHNMLHYFFEIAFPYAKRYRIDFVSGGEPLLGMEIIKEAITFAEEFSREKNKPVSIWLCTNGSLLTDEIIEYLSEHSVSIGVSLDGRKHLNDINRVDAEGRGTYNIVRDKIAMIKSNNSVSKKFKRIWGLCTITNDNCDFIDILSHLQSIGFSNVQMRLIRGSEKYNIERITTEFTRLAQYFLRCFENEDISQIKMVLNDNDQFGKVLKRVILNQILVRRCNSGINKITICPNGVIYPCDSLVGIEKFELGNVETMRMCGKPIQWFKDITVDSIPKCRKCDIKYLCGGDCFYNSYMKTGDELHPDDEFCQIQRHIIHLAIVLRFKMWQLNPLGFKKLEADTRRKNDYSALYG